LLLLLLPMEEATSSEPWLFEQLLNFTVFFFQHQSPEGVVIESESQQIICSQPAARSRHNINFCVDNEIQKLTNRNTSFLIPQ
jgi:hypothetical protein